MTNLQKQIAQIFDPTPETMQRKRMLWQQYHINRQQFLESIKDKRCSDYSDAVIARDKELRSVFHFAFNK